MPGSSVMDMQRVALLYATDANDVRSLRIGCAAPDGFAGKSRRVDHSEDSAAETHSLTASTGLTEECGAPLFLRGLRLCSIYSDAVSQIRCTRKIPTSCSQLSNGM